MSVFELWLPILVAGFATHLISTLAWLVLPHHKSEWQKYPAEEELLDQVGKVSIPAGQYIFPHAMNTEEMKSDEYQSKLSRCRGMLILWDKPVSMGAAIGQTLAFFFVAAFLIAYLASLALAPGALFLEVFRFTFTASLLTYCAGLFPGVFWFKRRVGMDLLDKLAFVLTTGVCFASFWPG